MRNRSTQQQGGRSPRPLRQHFIVVLVISSIALVVLPKANADDIGPRDVLENMRNAYAAMESYSGTGVVEIIVSVGGQDQTITKPFSITFKRPASIRIDWTDSFAGIPTPYVMWNATNGVFKYAKRMNQIGTYESIAQAIRSQSGSSGASVQHVPDMLLRVLKTPQFSDLNDLRPVSVEPIHGIACYRVSGTRKSKTVDLWIEKDKFILQEVRTSTRFGTVTEIHQKTGINVDVADAATSFTPPADAERVEKFDVRKNSGAGPTGSGRETRASALKNQESGVDGSE